VEDIRKWFGGSKDYDAGVALLLQHSQDQKLRRLFVIEGATDFKRKLLHDTLRKMLTAPKQAEPPKPVEQAVKSLKTQGKWPADKDPVVQALFNEWKPLFSEMNSLQSRIYEVAIAGLQDDARRTEAGAMAHRILDLDDMCEDIYQKRDHYLATGVLPAIQQPPVAEVVDPKKWPLALQNARRYVREFRIKVRKNPTNAKQAAKLQHWEKMVKHYQALLNIE
jgi:hypothetical protein